MEMEEGIEKEFELKGLVNEYIRKMLWRGIGK